MSRVRFRFRLNEDARTIRHLVFANKAGRIAEGSQATGGDFPGLQSSRNRFYSGAPADALLKDFFVTGGPSLGSTMPGRTEPSMPAAACLRSIACGRRPESTIHGDAGH